MNTTFAVYPTTALHPPRERGRDLGALDPSRTVEMQQRWWSPSLGRQWYLQERPFGHSSRVRCSWISSSKTLWSPASHTRSCIQALTTDYLVHQPVANWFPLCVVTDASSQELQLDPGVIPCLSPDPLRPARSQFNEAWYFLFPVIFCREHVSMPMSMCWLNSRFPELLDTRHPPELTKTPLFFPWLTNLVFWSAGR